MREIKFRGKSVHDGRWLYGDLMHNTETGQVAVAKCKVWNDFSKFDVIPSSVGQFVYLHDMDGKELYEGDIIKEIATGEIYKVFHSYFAWHLQNIETKSIVKFEDVGIFKIVGNEFDKSRKKRKKKKK